MTDTEQTKKDKKRKLLILLLLIGMAVCIAVTIWALFFRAPASSDYAPNKLDPNAQVIENDNSTKLEAPSGGGAHPSPS